MLDQTANSQTVLMSLLRGTAYNIARHELLRAVFGLYKQLGWLVGGDNDLLTESVPGSRQQASLGVTPDPGQH